MYYCQLRAPMATGICITLVIISVISAIEPNNVQEYNIGSILRRVQRSDDVDGSFSWRDIPPRLDNRAITRDNDFMLRRRKKCNSRIQVENGRRRILEQGSLVRFRCEYGYILFGASVAACVRGQWSEPPPVCISAGCRRPDLPQGIIGRPLFGGAAIVFECFPGYQMRGESTLVCNGLRWNGTAPTCNLIAPPTTTTSFTISTTKATAVIKLETSTTLEDDEDEQLSVHHTSDSYNEVMSTTESASFGQHQTSTNQQLLEKTNSEGRTVMPLTTPNTIIAHVTDKVIEIATEPTGRETFSTGVTIGTPAESISHTNSAPATTSIQIRRDYEDNNATTTTITTSATAQPKPITTAIPFTTSAPAASRTTPAIIITQKTTTHPVVTTTGEVTTVQQSTAGATTTVQAVRSATSTRKAFITTRPATTVGRTTTSPASTITTTKFTTTGPNLNTTVQPFSVSERYTTVPAVTLKFPETNNATTKFKNSTRDSTSDATKGAILLCAFIYRNRKQPKQLRDCLNYHLNSTIRPKPTPPAWRNRFELRPALNNSNQSIFRRNNSRARTWNSRYTIPFRTTTTLKPTTTFTPINVPARATGGSATISEATEKELLTTRLSLTSNYPKEEFDNTIEQVLRKPKEIEKVETQTEEKREFIIPFKLDTGTQGTEKSNGINMFATVSTLMALTAMAVFGVVFYYCWRRNKGIARRSRHESDGRNLSVHLDMDEEFVYFGNNR